MRGCGSDFKNYPFFLFRDDSLTRDQPPISMTGHWRNLSYVKKTRQGWEIYKVKGALNKYEHGATDVTDLKSDGGADLKERIREGRSGHGDFPHLKIFHA